MIVGARSHRNTSARSNLASAYPWPVVPRTRPPSGRERPPRRRTPPCLAQYNPPAMRAGRINGPQPNHKLRQAITGKSRVVLHQLRGRFADANLSGKTWSLLPLSYASAAIFAFVALGSCTVLLCTARLVGRHLA